MLFFRVLLPLTFVSSLLLLSSQPASAGPRYSLNERVHGADAIAIVHVTLGTKDATLRLDQWIHPELQDDQKAPVPDSSWIGLCLPDKALLTRWRAQYAHFKEGHPLYKRALDGAEYSAVVFLKRKGDGYTPTCGVETLDGRQWRHPPGFDEWMERLWALIRPEKPSTKPTKTPIPPRPARAR